MKVVIAGAGVSSVAYVGYGLALTNDGSFDEIAGVAREVRVVEDHLFVVAELIDRRTAAIALKQLQDLAVCGCKHGRLRWSRDVDRIVYTAFRSRVVKRVLQLIGTHSGYWNYQIHPADKTRFRFNPFFAGW